MNYLSHELDVDLQQLVDGCQGHGAPLHGPPGGDPLHQLLPPPPGELLGPHAPPGGHQGPEGHQDLHQQGHHQVTHQTLAGGLGGRTGKGGGLRV